MPHSFKYMEEVGKESPGPCRWRCPTESQIASTDKMLTELCASETVVTLYTVDLLMGIGDTRKETCPGHKYCHRFSKKCCRSKQDEEKILPEVKIRTAGNASVQYRSGEDLMNAQVFPVSYDENNSQPGIVPAGKTRKSALQMMKMSAS